MNTIEMTILSEYGQKDGLGPLGIKLLENNENIFKNI